MFPACPANSVKNVRIQPTKVWQCEEREITMGSTAMLMVRLVIAKVNNTSRLRKIFARVPIRADTQMG